MIRRVVRTVVLSMCCGLVLAAAADAAPTRHLAPHLVNPRVLGRSGDQVPLVLADRATVAYRDENEDAFVLRGDDRSIRRVAAPAGCRPETAGAGRLVFSCGVDATYDTVITHFLVTALDGGEQVAGAVATPASVTDPEFLNVGAQWIAFATWCYHCGADAFHVNWRTGEKRTDAGAATVFPDQDAPELMRPLCPPAIRPRLLDPEGVPAAPTAVTVRGSWTLVQDRGLFRCGRSGPLPQPPGVETLALGDGWAAQDVPVPHRGHQIQLVRLADGQRYAVTGVHGLGGFPVLTHRRLYVAGPTDAPRSMALYTVVLPGR